MLSTQQCGARRKRLIFVNNLLKRNGLTFAILLLLVGYPFVCKYNVNSSSLGFYDFLSMNPYILWYAIALVCLIGLKVYVDRKLSLFSVLAIVAIFSFFEVFSNYPLVFARDIYLQGSSVNSIIQNGHIVNAFNSYPQMQPGFFLVWTIVSLITGMSPIISNLFLLLPVAVVLFVLMLYVVYHRFGIRTDALCAIVLLAWLAMNNQVDELSFFQFNTRLYALILILGLLIVTQHTTIRNRIGKKAGAIQYQVLFIIVFFVLTISHILFSIVPIAFLLIYWAFEDKFNRNRIFTFLACLSIFLVWNVSFSPSYILEAINELKNVFSYSSSIQTAATLTTVTQNFPFYAAVLVQYYKVFLIGLALLSVWAMLKMRHTHEFRVLSYFLLSGVGVFFVLAFLSTVNSIDRFILYSAIFMSPLAILALTGNRIRVRKSVLFALTFVLLILVIPQFVLAHQDTLAVGNVQPTDSFCNYLLHSDGQKIVYYGDFRYYYAYFDPGMLSSDYISTTADKIYSVEDLYLGNYSHVIRVVDFRNIVDWGYSSPTYKEAQEEWSTNIYAPLNSGYDRIYDNGFDTAFR